MKNILLTEVSVQFPSIRDKNDLNTIDLFIWGNLGQDVMKYYKINDYILVEGFIYIHKEKLTNTQQIKISVFKIYPFNNDEIKINATL